VNFIMAVSLWSHSKWQRIEVLKIKNGHCIWNIVSSCKLLPRFT
jgi:hypothetical protein